MSVVQISLGPAQATVSLQATPGAASLVVKTLIQVRTCQKYNGKSVTCTEESIAAMEDVYVLISVRFIWPKKLAGNLNLLKRQNSVYKNFIEIFCIIIMYKYIFNTASVFFFFSM